MDMSREARARRNRSAVAAPRPGDYWHEMYCPIMIVLEVDPLIVCREQESVGDGWFWQLDKAYESDGSEFESMLYPRGSGVEGWIADVSRGGRVGRSTLNAWRTHQAEPSAAAT